jgi:hypothetical protein
MDDVMVLPESREGEIKKESDDPVSGAAAYS